MTGRIARASEAKAHPGMEIDIAEHGHTLVFGPFNEVMWIRRGLDGHTEESTFISAAGLVELVGDGARSAARASAGRPRQVCSASVQGGCVVAVTQPDRPAQPDQAPRMMAYRTTSRYVVNLQP